MQASRGSMGWKVKREATRSSSRELAAMAYREESSSFIPIHRTPMMNRGIFITMVSTPMGSTGSR